MSKYDIRADADADADVFRILVISLFNIINIIFFFFFFFFFFFLQDGSCFTFMLLEF